MLVQVSPTGRARFPARPTRPPREPTNGLAAEVMVLQHCTVPVLHWLTDGTVGGGQRPLATGVAAAATVLAAAMVAIKETKGLESIIVRTR
jgi:hypothetical protein